MVLSELFEIFKSLAGIGSIITASILIWQFRLTRKNIQIRERPWIVAYRPPNENTAVQYLDDKFIIQITNKGPVPAKEIRYWTAYSDVFDEERPVNDDAEVNFDSDDSGRLFDLGPGETLNLYVCLKNGEQKDTVKKKLESKTFFYEYLIIYQDLNGKIHSHHARIRYYEGRSVAVSYTLDGENEIKFEGQFKTYEEKRSILKESIAKRKSLPWTDSRGQTYSE